MRKVSREVTTASPGEIITYSHEEADLRGILKMPAGAPRAGVLVCHEGPGLGDHVRRRVQMLADLGYATFALDMFGDGSPMLEGPAMMERMAPWIGDRARLRERALAGYDQLISRCPDLSERVFAIGFCFGGTVALELARMGLPLLGVASFHGGLKAGVPTAPETVRARVLSLVGTRDPLIPLADRNAFEAEMEAAGAGWQQTVFSGAGHSFTNTNALDVPGFGYNHWADTQAWAAMQSMLDACLKSKSST